MAIRFDRSYNARITRVVKNFNQKRNRAIKRGFKDVPPPIRVSDLKARYTTRNELNKQLTQLSKFSSSKDVLKRVENQGGAQAIKWELGYLKSNLNAAKEFFQKEYQLVASKVGDFPGERMRLDTIAKKLNTLDLDLAYMNQSQFNTFRSAIREYINKPKKYGAGYRGFLNEIEQVMTLVGIDKDTQKQFFDKISVLTPEQFNKLYQTNDLVARIYELADSPIYTGSIKLNASEEEAEDLVKTLIEETDDIVKQAQNEDLLYGYEPTKKEIPSTMKGKKIPKSSLSSLDISKLKSLGWDDLIDESK